MSNAAIPLRRCLFAIALVPAFLVAGCGSQDDAAFAQQVAIAKDAADRAVKAQKAAERAASLARSQSAPASFAEDEIVEEVDYSSPDDADASGGEDSTSPAPGTSVPR